MKLDRNKIEIAMANAKIPTVQALADAMGCTKQSLTPILSRGSCRVAFAIKLADTLGVTASDIARKEE